MNPATTVRHVPIGQTFEVVTPAGELTGRFYRRTEPSQLIGDVTCYDLRHGHRGLKVAVAPSTFCIIKEPSRGRHARSVCVQD